MSNPGGAANNLGYTLQILGDRQPGAEGVRRLTEAVEAYREALTVRTRDPFPLQWAMTQINLGGRLCEAGRTTVWR